MKYKFIITKTKNYLSSLYRFSSQNYWDDRYKTGGSSGPGSCGRLANFKAKILNEFISKNSIESVIEFGCGDGMQLSLGEYKKYTGYDVSRTAVDICRNLFKKDPSKEFFLIQDFDNRKADLVISLDVIFHIIEDNIFENYMQKLFNASSRFVIIYSSNQNEPIPPVSTHVKHCRFSEWIEKNTPHWRLLEIIPNLYPYNGDSLKTSFADFYIYEKA